jgi:hypothetical protein
MVILAFVALLGFPSPDSVTPYPLPVGDVVSAAYSVTVNGTNVPVSNSRDASYAHFAFTGTARIVVTVSQAVTSFRLSPAAAGIAPTVSGSVIQWTLTRPRKLILHHVNNLSEKLCILAEPPEEAPPKSGDPGVVVLAGLDATGRTDVSAGLQAALDGVPEGGTLVIPAGRYGFTTFRMRSGKSCYLAPGSVLEASGTGRGPDATAQVSFTGVTNVTLSGCGVIDGRGYALRKAVAGREEGRPLLSVAHGSSSSNVTIRGVIIRNPPVYSCIVFDTSDWRFTDVKFITDADYANRDGIAPHNAQRLIIDDCLFLTSDDCVVCSTTRPDVNLATIVKNCVMYNSVSGAFIRLGPWIGDGTRNFAAENIDMIQGCERAGNEAGIAMYAGGALSDVRFRNIRVEDPHWRLISMVTRWKDHYAGDKRGSVSDVVFERLSCDSKGLVSLSGGSPSEPIRQVSFKDFVYRGKAVLGAGDCDYAESGTVSGVTFAAGSAPVLTIRLSALESIATSDAEVVVTRSVSSSSPLSVKLMVRGTAKPGLQYTPLPTTVTIPPNERSVSLGVHPLVTTASSGPTTVLVELDHSASRSYMLGPEHRVQMTLPGVVPK